MVNNGTDPWDNSSWNDPDYWTKSKWKKKVKSDLKSIIQNGDLTDYAYDLPDDSILRLPFDIEDSKKVKEDYRPILLDDAYVFYD